MKQLLVVCLLLSAPSFAASMSPLLINGTPVAEGEFQDIVRIRSQGGYCTATIVGPRVIITAAHCAESGTKVTFKHKGADYSATVERSRFYTVIKDHDIAVGIVDKDIVDAEPFNIGGTAAVGTKLAIYGYGCTVVGGTGGNDGVLRTGFSEVTKFQRYDMISTLVGGAALCFGDSGGPSFTEVGGELKLLGINSKGNIKDTNYNTRTDEVDSLRFLNRIVKEQKVKICGISEEC